MPATAEKASPALALCDFIPNILYLAGSLTFAFPMAAGGRPGAGRMFACGAVLVFAAGFLKAVSKLADALHSRPVSERGFFYDQMIPVMAIGFLATAAAVLCLPGRPAPGLAVSVAAHSVAALFLGAAIFLSALANRPELGLRPAFMKYKRASLIAMIVFQLVTVGVLAALAFRAGNALAGTACALSITAALAMGALGAPGVQARFQNRVAMNWIDEGVNVFAQAAYLVAALFLATPGAGF